MRARLAVLIKGVLLVYLYNNGGVKNGGVPEVGNAYALEYTAFAQVGGTDTSLLEEERR
jgi:hypothetical protein